MLQIYYFSPTPAHNQPHFLFPLLSLLSRVSLPLVFTFLLPLFLFSPHFFLHLTALPSLQKTVGRSEEFPSCQEEGLLGGHRGQGLAAGGQNRSVCLWVPYQSPGASYCKGPSPLSSLSLVRETSGPPHAQPHQQRIRRESNVTS